jgi:hypothetical protein
MKKIERALIDIIDSRKAAAAKQAVTGGVDKGMRSEVTSGGHLDAVANAIADVFVDAGIPRDWVYCGKAGLELPGFFRAEKKWDIIVANERRVIAAVELKSIWGSYGNNLNNRAEEAIGSAMDIAKALRAGLLGESSPWLGYVFIIKDDDAIHRQTSFKEPHFSVDAAFKASTYAKRFEILCWRLITERLYDSAWYVRVRDDGEYSEPNHGMTWSKFEAAIQGKVLEELA